MQILKKFLALGFSISFINFSQAIKSPEEGKDFSSNIQPPFLLQEYPAGIKRKLNKEEKRSAPVLIHQEDATDIRFPKEVTWGTGHILEIQAAGNTIFPKEFTAPYTGRKGGLILKSYGRAKKPDKGRTIKLEEVGQIDLSESRDGMVSLFHNPLPVRDDSHRYLNLSDLTRPIFSENKAYFSYFGVVNNLQDLQLITRNFNKNYNLSNHMSGVDFDYQNELQGKRCNAKRNRIQCKFNGILNYNGFYLSSTSYSGKCVVNPPLADSLWCYVFIFMAPPLHEKYEQLLNLILVINEKTATRLMGHEKGQEFFGIRLAYVNEDDLPTPLHLAAQYRLTKVIKTIYENVMRNISQNVTQEFGVSEFSFINYHDAQEEFAPSLSARYGYAEATKYFIELYMNHKKIYSQQLIKEDIADQQRKGAEAYKNIHLYLDVARQQEKPQLSEPFWQGFPDNHKVQEKEYESDQKVHSLFFLRQLGATHTGTLWKMFLDKYKEGQESTPNLDNTLGRTCSLLLNPITSFKLNTLPIKLSETPLQKEENELWEYSRESPEDSISPYLGIVDKLTTSYQSRVLVHTLVNNPTESKFGYVHYEKMRAHENQKNKNKGSNINRKITKISRHIDAQKITELLRQPHVSGQPILPSPLLSAGHKSREALQDDANYLKQFNFLLDVEVASKLVHDPDGKVTEHDTLPIGIGWTQKQSSISEGRKSYSDLKCSIKNPELNLFTGKTSKLIQSLTPQENEFKVHHLGHYPSTQIFESETHRIFRRNEPILPMKSMFYGSLHEDTLVQLDEELLKNKLAEIFLQERIVSSSSPLPTPRKLTQVEAQPDPKLINSKIQCGNGELPISEEFVPSHLQHRHNIIKVEMTERTREKALSIFTNAIKRHPTTYHETRIFKKTVEEKEVDFKISQEYANLGDALPIQKNSNHNIRSWTAYFDYFYAPSPRYSTFLHPSHSSSSSSSTNYFLLIFYSFANLAFLFFYTRMKP